MVTSPSPQLSPISRPHLHFAGEFCPYCEQPIPNEKADQIRARAEAKERELSERLTAQLTQKFALEKARMEANAKAQVDQARNESAAALEKLHTEIALRETAAREEGKKAAEAMLHERLADQERTSNQRLQEVRDAYEADKVKALNAERAKHFDENQALSSKVEELKRQLEKKTANELGEGAEIDLFETLKGTFDGDRIRRVAKGTPGADIVHEIIHNDKVCGTIVYDSKNRNRWCKEYVTKLREDKIAAKAEHAILATFKFPAEQSQLCEQDGVIIANPARVSALAHMLRHHVVQMHNMRLSNSERSQKTAALYEFIRSERCEQLFERIYSQAEDLLKLQELDKKAHDKMWNRQGTLVRGIQKANGELTSEIDRIIGTGSDAG